jgi:peptidoglycan lytic transglycosylase
MLNNMANKFRYIMVCVLVATGLASCNLMPGLAPVKDSAPSVSVDPEKIIDAIPRRDQITRAGNKNPYTVLGKTYHLLASSEGYKEQGLASWYGTKFHGRPTANGERYSLYGMTAAHRTLPIPAYVKVTNLENNRTAIVRVNDRGPFHHQRIIDLSYAAAVKLGYAEQGTARVQVEVITPDTPRALPVTATSTLATATAAVITTTTKSAPQRVAPLQGAQGSERYFLQVAAFRDFTLASKLQRQLASVTTRPVQISATEPAGYYRVQIGPIKQLQQVQQISERLIEMNMGQPRLISE